MTIDLSNLGPIVWVIALLAGAMVVLGILGFIFKHIFHWFARGCGCLATVILILIILRALKIL